MCGTYYRSASNTRVGSHLHSSIYFTSKFFEKTDSISGSESVFIWKAAINRVAFVFGKLYDRLQEIKIYVRERGFCVTEFSRVTHGRAVYSNSLINSPKTEA